MTELEWFLNEGEKDASAADLMVEALFQLTIASFDELVKYSGKAEALAAVKPYRKWQAQYLITQAKKRLNIQSNGPDAMLLIHAFAGAISVAPADKVECLIAERGAIGIARGCMFKNAPPELCMTISHYQTEAIAEAINPDYECIWTHHESSGDPYCRGVWKKKSDPISVLDDMGKTLTVLPKFEFHKEEVQAARIWAFVSFVYAYASAFRNLHGEEKMNEVMGAVASEIGQEIGTKLAKQNPELTESIESIGMLVKGMQNAWGQRDNFVIVSVDEVSNEVTDCSFCSVSDPICEVYEALFNGMVSAINPNYEFFYDRMITQGDKTCHWNIKKRGKEPTKVEPVASENKMEEQVIEDPIRLLALMLARGEIDEEEFERMMELLRKHKVAP